MLAMRGEWRLPRALTGPACAGMQTANYPFALNPVD